MRVVTRNYVVVPNTWSDCLTPAEAAALNAISNEVRDKRILDLGVGAGRTVKALREISRDYIGIDYVAEMVAECRSRFPGVRFEEGDATDLPQFEDNSFSLIMFSCNGICMVGHEGRLAILKEAYRLLAPGGTLIFSTCNRDSSSYKAFFRFPFFQFTKNPIRLAGRIMLFLYSTCIGMINRARFIRLEKRHPAYSIINDVCHNYSTMFYYISLESQHAQLESIGFQNGAVAFDQSGQMISGNTTDNSFTILARK